MSTTLSQADQDFIRALVRETIAEDEMRRQDADRCAPCNCPCRAQVPGGVSTPPPGTEFFALQGKRAGV